MFLIRDAELKVVNLNGEAITADEYIAERVLKEKENKND